MRYRPIEEVAADLRRLRIATGCYGDTPDPWIQGRSYWRRLSAYDQLLLQAAEQLQLELPRPRLQNRLLRHEDREVLENALSEAGLQVI